MQENRARKERNHVRINPACDDADWKDDYGRESKKALPPQRDSTQLYIHAKEPLTSASSCTLELIFQLCFHCVPGVFFRSPSASANFNLLSDQHQQPADGPTDRPAGKHTWVGSKKLSVKRVNSDPCFIKASSSATRQTDQCRQKWLCSKSATFNCAHWRHFCRLDYTRYFCVTSVCAECASVFLLCLSEQARAWVFYSPFLTLAVCYF